MERDIAMAAWRGNTVTVTTAGNHSTDDQCKASIILTSLDVSMAMDCPVMWVGKTVSTEAGGYQMTT